MHVLTCKRLGTHKHPRAKLVALPAWRRRRQRKQAKLPHHSHIIPIRKVLGNLAIEHPIHVHWHPCCP